MDRRSALALVLTEADGGGDGNALYAGVQGLRQEHDKAFAAWPPHVSLVWPGPSAAQFWQRLGDLEQALAALPPLVLDLDTVTVMDQGKKTGDARVYLVFDLKDCQPKLRELWETCCCGLGLASNSGGADGCQTGPEPGRGRPVKGRGKATGAAPASSSRVFHLTVGQAPRVKAAALVKELARTWKPQQWHVSSVAFLTMAEGSSRFEPEYLLALGPAP
eukprot:m.39942 g.39942  ORF g.39942 m.39942 type:complete len:219 (-) comp11325_c0_seq1:341-997(-)